MRGSFPTNFNDTPVQTDLYMLQDSDSPLETDSKVRSILVCFEDRLNDPSVFTMQLEVWSRRSDSSLWLSTIGDPDLVEEQASIECEVY